MLELYFGGTFARLSVINRTFINACFYHRVVKKPIRVNARTNYCFKLLIWAFLYQIPTYIFYIYIFQLISSLDLYEAFLRHFVLSIIWFLVLSALL